MLRFAAIAALAAATVVAGAQVAFVPLRPLAGHTSAEASSITLMADGKTIVVTGTSFEVGTLGEIPNAVTWDASGRPQRIPIRVSNSTGTKGQVSTPSGTMIVQALMPWGTELWATSPGQGVWRMRKRPEILYQAWDDAVGNRLVSSNPLYQAGHTKGNNPLAGSRETNLTGDEEAPLWGMAGFSITSDPSDPSGSIYGGVFSLSGLRGGIIHRDLAARNVLLKLLGGDLDGDGVPEDCVAYGALSGTDGVFGAVYPTGFSNSLPIPAMLTGESTKTLPSPDGLTVEAILGVHRGTGYVLARAAGEPSPRLYTTTNGTEWSLVRTTGMPTFGVHRISGTIRQGHLLLQSRSARGVRTLHLARL